MTLTVTSTVDEVLRPSPVVVVDEVCLEFRVDAATVEDDSALQYDAVSTEADSLASQTRYYLQDPVGSGICQASG